MVILHDAMKTIQNGVFVFFPKKQKPVIKQNGLKKQQGFYLKKCFSQP